MATQRYSVTPHPIETLLTWVKSGEIAIPEIQRPFVWEATKVRNLLDSLYQGREFELDTGATLLLYTDGLTEARREGVLFGEQRLLDTVGAVSDRTPTELVEQLRDTVLGYAGTLQDDLEILAVRRQAQGA